MSFNSIPMPDFLANTRDGREHERKIRFSLVLAWLMPAFFLLGLPQGYAQNPSFSAVVEAADEAFQKEDYYNAYHLYRKAVVYKKADLRTQYKLAEAARMANMYSVAVDEFIKVISDSTYRQMVDAGDTEVTRAPLRLGQLYTTGDNCSLAVNYFDDYLRQPNMPSDGIREAEQGLRNCQHAGDMKSGFPEDTLVHLDESVNTYYMEFSPVEQNGTLYYASFRFDDQADKVKPRRKFFRIMEMSDSVSTKVLPDSDHKGKHTGHPAFTPDGRRMYYTVCEYIDKSLDIRCDIYYRDRNSEKQGKPSGGRWGKPEKVSFNDSTATNTMPSVGVDASGQEVIFFASNRGGKTDLDLYYVPKTGPGPKDYGTPRPLSGVNTSGDDVSPFYAIAQNTLYFSTDGRPTMGGLDIYRVSGSPGNWGTPEPMEVPYNTTYDDLYYSVSETNEKRTAYLASDRLVNDSIVTPQSGKERCCHDIFRIDLPIRPELCVTVYCDNQYSPFDSVNCEVAEVVGYGEEPVTNYQIQPDGKHCYPVKRDARYRIRIDMVGFTKVDTIINIDRENLPTPPEIALTFRLKQLLKINVVDSETREPVTGAELILYDAADPDNLIYPNPDYPSDPGSNVFEFPVAFRAGNSYVIEINAPGYNPLVNSDILANIDQSLICNPFSLDVDLPPPPPPPNCLDSTAIQLFFENNEPGPYSRYAYTTTTDYGQTFEDYASPENINTYQTNFESDFGKLTPEIKTQFLNSINLDAAAIPNRIDGFFDLTVKANKRQLDNFIEEVKRLLESGTPVELKIAGFASPKGNPIYNIALSRRRISSVKRYMLDSLGLAGYFRSGLLAIDTTDYNGSANVQEAFKPVLDIFDALRVNFRKYGYYQPLELDTYSVLAGSERRVEVSVVQPICGDYDNPDPPYPTSPGYEGDDPPDEYSPYRSYDGGDNNDN